jgi:hypothetical protein
MIRIPVLMMRILYVIGLTSVFFLTDTFITATPVVFRDIFFQDVFAAHALIVAAKGVAILCIACTVGERIPRRVRIPIVADGIVFYHHLAASTPFWAVTSPIPVCFPAFKVLCKQVALPLR